MVLTCLSLCIHPHLLCGLSVGLGCVWPWLLSLSLILTLADFPAWTRTCLTIMDMPAHLFPGPILIALLLLLRGYGDWALVGEGSALQVLLSHLVASCSLGSSWSPSSFHITFHTSSDFVFAKPSFCVHTPFLLLPFLLSKSPLSHSPTSTHLLTCWWTVSFLLSLLGCVNHGLAFQWYEGIGEDEAVSGKEHRHQIDSKSQGNHQGWITPHPNLLSTWHTFVPHPPSANSQNFPGITALGHIVTSLGSSDTQRCYTLSGRNTMDFAS